MASLAPLTVPSTGSDSQIGDKEVEELLSEKLLEGYTLLNTACPRCVTPLVKRKNSALSPKRLHASSSRPSSPYVSMSYVAVQLQPSNVASGSFDVQKQHNTFTPVNNVPICVSCQAHVVTCQADIATLESANSMKDHGSIIVAMEEEEREEQSVASPGRIAEKSFFPTTTEKRESPEEYVEQNHSDKENGVMEEVRDDVVVEKKELVLEEPEVPVVVEEEPVVESKESPVQDEEQEEMEDESSMVHEEEAMPAQDEEPETEPTMTVQVEESFDEENSIVEEMEEVKKDAIRNKYDAILSNQTSPMSKFLCASTASYQYVVPSPISTPMMSFIEEEGIEHDLDEHTRCMERAGLEAAFSALLPPKPLMSDLLQVDEKEQLDHARLALSTSHARQSPRAQQGDESVGEADEIMQEYSVR